MRAGNQQKGISIHAISGTHVVLLGFDIAEENIGGLLGFAVERTDHTRRKKYWLNGFKTFPNFAIIYDFCCWRDPGKISA